MIGAEFAPNKFIDREFEIGLFKRMLRSDSDARILAICDDKGMGKSTLLERFLYHCRVMVRPCIPVSLIRLGQLNLEDRTPLFIVQTIVKDLCKFDESFFRKFKHYNFARVSGDFSKFVTSIYFDNATFEGSNVHIANVNIEYVENANITPGGALSEEQDRIARGRCLEIFIDELRAISSENPVVLLFDDYERCFDEENEIHLNEWIIDALLRKMCFDSLRRPARLRIVLAGEKLPRFTVHWPPEECESTVDSVTQLYKWERHHVKEWLHIHQLDYSKKLVDAFYTFIQRGLPPSKAIEMLDFVEG